MPGEAPQQPEAGAGVGAEGEGKKKKKKKKGGGGGGGRREGLREVPLVIPRNHCLIPLVSGVDGGSSEPGICDVYYVSSLIPRLHCGVVLAGFLACNEMMGRVRE